MNFAKKFDFKTRTIDIKAQKINNFKLDTFGIVIVFYLIGNQKKGLDFLIKAFY